VTGELGFLPIHAASQHRGANAESVMDYLVSSYVPTLSALIKARQSWQPILRAEVSALLICEASTGHNYLPNVVGEARAVRECFKAASAPVINEPTSHMTLARAQSFLRDSAFMRVLHIASHGIQEPNPLESAFLMEDGRLSIAEIMKLDLPQAVLAFLSACQTAKGDREAPDQAVHLAASMLFCGFRSVVGTMWCVELMLVIQHNVNLSHTQAHAR
jgi:CHAT domain-containing protein